MKPRRSGLSLAACLLLASLVSASSQAPLNEYLDHPLDDYQWVIGHDAGLRQAITDWCLAFSPDCANGEISIRTIQHIRWRYGIEYARWERDLGEPLTLRKILEWEWSSATASAPQDPDPSYRWVDLGVVLRPGDPDRVFGGISPGTAWFKDGEIHLTYVAGNGRRPDGDPAYRRAYEAVIRDGVGVKLGLVKAWSTNSPVNPEAGVFSLTRRYYGAITAATSTTDSVTSDVRRISDDALVLDHADPAVEGYDDELWPLVELPGGRLLYGAKGRDLYWGLAMRYPDGRTEVVIDAPDEYPVRGNGGFEGYVLLMRGRNAHWPTLEWYRDPDYRRPIRTERINVFHAAPFWDGSKWLLFGGQMHEQAIHRYALLPVTPAGRDEIDPRAVTWAHATMTDWPITTEVTDVTFTDDTITIQRTATSTLNGHWPRYGGPGSELGGQVSDGSPWVFGFIDGEWHGATFEWLRPDQETVILNGGIDTIGAHTKEEPLESWVPRSGELVGFAMATRSRDDGRTSDERTNIVLVPWP